MGAIFSMTGYGEGSAPARGAEGVVVRAELRSVNGRFLDMSFRLPDELRGCESTLRSRLAAQLRRGKLECRLNLDMPARSQAVTDTAALEPLLQAQQQLLQRWPQLRALSVAELWRMAESQPLERADAGELASAALDAAQRALQALQAARAAEGERLREFLLERCTRLRELAAQAALVAPQAVQRLQERFVARFREALELLGGQPDAQAVHERLLQEAAAFAVRIDVAEEVGRLQSHLDAMGEALARGGELGKRLDFLIQELHREANTLGSKSAVLELSEIAVDMKVCIEQMREQVQNLE